MSLTYVPPGVTVEELTSPSIAPLLALPGSVCLVGPASGVIQRTDLITLTGTTPVVLPSVPAQSVMTSQSIISVFDAVDPGVAPTGFSSSTDYTFVSADYTIARQSGGLIVNGHSVFVTYTYTPVDYFQPIRLNSMADIQVRFGSAWDATTTTVGSPLSHAASLVFENGASNVVLQPLFVLNNGVPQQPIASDIADPTVWQTVFNNLLSLEDINIVVAVVGQSFANVTDSAQLSILQVTQDFVYSMKVNNDIFVIGVLAEDSSASSSNAQDTTLQAHAQVLESRYGGAVTEQLVFINVAQFSRANAQSSFAIGGQYAAAAVAGMLASRDPASTLTRQAVSGFLSVTDQRTKSQKNTDASEGMLVVESKGNIVQVRHAITMDNADVATRELNVVRSKHFIIASVQQTLDTQVIGQVVADADAPTLVNNVVIGVLEELRGLGQLVDYANVASRITTLDPTAMEVRFSYQPVFVVNYITVIFSLDLTSGTIALSDVTTNATS